MNKSLFGALLCLMSASSVAGQEAFDLVCQYTDGSGRPFYFSDGGRVQAAIHSVLGPKGYTLEGDALAFATRPRASSTAGKYCFLDMDMTNRSDAEYTYTWNRRMGGASPCQSLASDHYIEIDRMTLDAEVLYNVNNTAISSKYVCAPLADGQLDQLLKDIEGAASLVEPPAPPAKPKI